jgi:quinohemoprotein ethanol dehydrogenase
VYLPAQNVPVNLMDDKKWEFNQAGPGKPQSGTGWNTAKFFNAEPPKSKPLAACWPGTPLRKRLPGAWSMSRPGTAAR